MLIAGIAIWLVLVLFFVALCRGAASADGRDLDSTEGYPSTASLARVVAAGPAATIAGLVLLEDRPAPAAQDLRARDRGARGRAGQYAAGS
jgi:hypothetical protein